MKKEIQDLKIENDRLVKIAKFTATEGVVAVDKANNIVFMNDRASENIPDTNHFTKYNFSKIMKELLLLIVKRN